ncbi:high frequency lysogenization protein HflD [Thalassotalea loyana]|uniref:High frequency lysogenization protein HflD homolog n=1 Tax=Thalassotalea loyana TaxID=280483 RepID=A0ABQ6HHW3_9GAMM|nr:high frequency lysogenization protein HflD [Thalassotalea loyana]GLX86395.1 high frequency lysogenization protein HflD [Thalassotalea loyana]
MASLQEQTFTFAAICQISNAVQRIARFGVIDEQQLHILLNTVMETSPENTLAVFGGDLANLRPGLNVLVDQLGNQNKQKDAEVTRYLVSLLALERKLAKSSLSLNQLGQHIDDTKRQLQHFELTSETIVSSLAGTYVDVISPLGTKIQIAGEPEILKNPVNQAKIRALLLAGIRCAVLWRQIGGKRRHILFARSKYLECAQELINKI